MRKPRPRASRLHRAAVACLLVLACCHLPSAPLAAANTLSLDEPPKPDGVGIKEGDSDVQLRAHYGVPILQKSFFWDGNGEDDNFGLGVHAHQFLADRFALGLGANGVVWKTVGHDHYGFEAEAVTRWYVGEFPSWRLFIDGSAGFQQSTSGVPDGGTDWNFSFSWGAGVDVPVGPGRSLLGGISYHHISNALGRENDRNPSQNEARFWVGYGWSW